MHAPKWRRAMIASTASVSLLLATPGFAALAQTDSPSAADSTAVDSPTAADPTVADSSDAHESEDEASATAEGTTTVADAPAASGQSDPVAEPSEEEEEAGPIVSIKHEVFVRVDGSTVAAWWSPVDEVKHYTVKLLNTSNNAVVGDPKHTVHNRDFFYNVAPGTYKVEVTAWTNNTSADQPFTSEPLTVSNERTKPEAPNAPYVELVKGNKVNVEWQRNSNGGFSITYSEITLTPKDGSAPIVHKVDGDEGFAEIPNLVSGKTYTATVTATNNLGTSEPSPASTEFTVTSDPNELHLTVEPTHLDATVSNTLTVRGSGYTGGAAANGVYIVVWNSQKWVPGSRPSSADYGYGHSILVPASEINAGAFEKTITIPPNSLELNKGAQYVVGTLAGKDLIASDRRLDKAVPLTLQAQPVPYVNGSFRGNSLEATWGNPTDARVVEFNVSLYEIKDGKREFKNKISKGRPVRSLQFLDLKPGTYVIGIRANVGTDFDPIFSPEVFSRPITLEAKKLLPPKAPTGVGMRVGDVPNSVLMWWVDATHEDHARATGYSIIFEDGTRQIVKPARADDSQLTFTDIPAGTWTVKVIAHSREGDSPASEKSAPVTIAAAPVVRNLNLQVSQDLIDTSKDATVTVTGSGYTDTDNVMLAIVPVDQETPKIAEATAMVQDGRFTHTLQIPAKSLDPKKKYTVLSYKGEDYKERALLKLADPAVAKPQLIADNTVVSADRATTISVTGSGYVGDGAANGTYVFVYDTSSWTPGTVLNKTVKLAAQAHVSAAQIRDGRFATVLNIPAGTLEKGKQYAIGTSAAHALSQTDRSLDFSLPLTVKFPEAAPTTSAEPTTSAPTTSAKPSTSAPKPEPKPSTSAPTTSAKPSTSAPKPEPKPSTSAPKPEPKPSTSAPTTSAKPTQPAPKPEPKPEPKPGTNPWVIVASVLGVVAAIAAALGAVAALFPQAVNMLKARLGL